jgi:tryptophanyl-tRNA synthetase
VDCKMKLAAGVTEHFAPLRERRASFEAAPEKLDEIMRAGTERAREVAAQTMAKVHDAMGIG